MGLNDIKLEPLILQDLYKKTLIETVSQSPAVNDTDHKTTFSFLGNNKKGIVIIVESKEAMHLPDDALNFLLGILSACKLTMEDVAVLNIEKNKPITYQSIATSLKAGSVLLFGIDCSQIGLPIQFPHYQVQSYNNQVYLSSPLLSAIQNDKAAKTKLWNCLKQVFSII